MQYLDDMQLHKDDATGASFKENKISGGDCLWERNLTTGKMIGMIDEPVDDE